MKISGRQWWRQRMKRWLLPALAVGCAGGWFLATAADNVRPPRFKAVAAVEVPPEGVKELQAIGQMEIQTAVPPEFDARMRQAVQWFPEIEITHQSGTNRFNRVTLNRHGAGLDAVRFKAPEGTNDGYNLLGVLGVPAGKKPGWNILPVEGEMNRFRFCYTTLSDHLAAICPWNRLPEDYTGYTQPLDGGEIKPGREYIIWFKFRDRSPMDLFMAVNLVPKGTPILQDEDQLRVMDLE